jgi:N-acyl-L-homoserine lactone synthetase
LPTSSMMKRLVSSLTLKTNAKPVSQCSSIQIIKEMMSWQNTCSSGKAIDSKDAMSTLYLPTLGHVIDSWLPTERNK